ncbi:DUF3857 domain-containing protein [Mucilaginibacter sp. UR6-1]|uniref:DUF3857 domain-containing protein n=1 Tax=Mucilaginibacter sp. UR6-1 TaxID=1435643 RepID=UPI001E320615|nr:DUF3857 domain-containing protein [Mucilaginibacter sp. UR6-1]MCC8410260.1 DUF3857 domain-containing protein [Mucilaginibacter sp. UR6-1]
MKKFLLALAPAIFALCTSVNAQDFDYGKFSYDELNSKSYNNDTSAHAVVLKEYGNARIGEADRITVEFDYHVKIKIFDNKGFDNGNIEIPIRVNSDSGEEITDVEGVTYYINEKGEAVRAELNPKNVYTVKDNIYWTTVKFAMPAVRNGCVIEYKYHLRSPYIFKFKSWDFQSDIPKVSSVYQVRLPAVYNYKISLRGFLKLLEGKEYEPQLDRECFSVNGIKADCSRFLFAMKDIPAFKEEEYMTSKNNFLSALNFELEDYTSLNTGSKVKVTKEWKDVDREMRTEESFGSQLKKKDFFKDKLVPVLAGKSTNLEKAQAVYHFIQKNIKFNKIYGMYCGDGVKKSFEKHTGNSADINIALIVALKSAGIDADAVIMSTRDHGQVTKIYPVLSEFDYVVAKAEIDGKSYFLDATDPLLGFGMLPFRCLNDQGRVFSLEKPSFWIDFAIQKETTTYSLDFKLQENGKLKGTISSYLTGYDAYRKRAQIKKFNTVDEFIENYDERMSKIKILKGTINNIDSLEAALIEKYEVEIDVYDNLDAKKFTFNPFLLNKITENPFKLEERNYPVDWGVASTERITLNIELPQNYKVEYSPKNVGLALPDNGGRFITNFNTTGNVFTFSHIIQLNKPVYSASEYPYIKELFNQIILAQKVDLLFTKG